MNTNMAAGASERLDAQIADALFGQPGMSKMDVANRLRQLRGDGGALLGCAAYPAAWMWPHPEDGSVRFTADGDVATEAASMGRAVSALYRVPVQEDAQPSPTGQAEALALIQRYENAGARFHDSLHDDHCSDERRVELLKDRDAAREALVSALAARQPVGQIVGYMDPDADFMLARHGDCVLMGNIVLWREPGSKYTKPLYDAPPAQGWVVADGQGARWRMWGSCGPEWTSDRDQALHFARRADAEAFANDDEDAWLIQPVGAPAQAVDLPYSLDADPAGIRARVCDVITGTLMVGAQGHTPPPAGHWAEPFWKSARADAAAQAVELGPMHEALQAAARSLRTIADSTKGTEFLETASEIRAYAGSRANCAEKAVIDHHRRAFPENGS